MVSEVVREIQHLRDYLAMPQEEVPEDWRVFVQEYQRQKEQAEEWVTSDDPDLRRRMKQTDEIKNFWMGVIFATFTGSIMLNIYLYMLVGKYEILCGGW